VSGALWPALNQQCTTHNGDIVCARWSYKSGGDAGNGSYRSPEVVQGSCLLVSPVHRLIRRRPLCLPRLLRSVAIILIQQCSIVTISDVCVTIQTGWNSWTMCRRNKYWKSYVTNFLHNAQKCMIRRVKNVHWTICSCLYFKDNSIEQFGRKVKSFIHYAVLS